MNASVRGKPMIKERGALDMFVVTYYKWCRVNFNHTPI